MRPLLTLFAVLLLGAAPPPKDWRLTTGTAPSGGFTVGNPAAKTRLVEYLSFTCPHCGYFVEESKAALHDALVRDGAVLVETRTAARDPYDLTAWLLARCGGPRRFHSVSSAIFAGQEAWMTKGNTYVQANLTAIKAMPQLAQLRTIATHSGLSAIATQAGVTPAAQKACLSSDAALQSVLTMTEASFAKVNGTPAFEVNGTLAAGVHDWGALEPQLRTAIR